MSDSAEDRLSILRARKEAAIAAVRTALKEAADEELRILMEYGYGELLRRHNEAMMELLNRRDLPDNPYTYGADTLTPEESDRIKARFDTEEETI